MISNLKTKILKTSISLLSFTLIIPAFAGEKLEEVVVTANKRAENINDVTTSITSLDNTYIDNMGVNRIEDLVGLTNNLHFTESGLSTQVRIRGIGSGNSQGFEQSVSQFVDGVYYGRAQLFRAPLYDLQNVEILRGSQNALFGKDSIAGAVIVNTANATDETYSRISAAYNDELNQKQTDFVVNGAITDSLNARLSLYGLTDDGYFENTTKGKSGTREEKSARLKLNWQASEKFTVDAKIESTSFEVEGRPYEITMDIASPRTLDVIAGKPGNAALKAIPSTYNNILTVLLKQPGFDADADWQRQTNAPEFSDNHINNYSLHGIYDFGGVEWHNTIAAVNYGYDESVDADYTPANILTLELDEEYHQYSIDSFIKNADTAGNKWMAGIYAQQAELLFNDRFFVPSDSVLKAIGNPLPGSGAKRAFEQDEDTFSVYGEYGFNLTKSTTLVLNGRYTFDSKDATRSLNIINENDQIITSPALACAYLYGVKADTIQSKGLPNDCGAKPINLAKGFSAGHDLDQSRNENSFTPSATINHQVDELNSVYFAVKSGHKSGGFDPRSNAANSFEFDEENALTYELGLRSESASGQFENGISVFHTIYDDLQVSQYDGALGFNVGNANKTESTGFEFDGRALITPEWLVFYSAGYVDIEYKDFKNGNCYQGQTPDGTDINGDGVSDLCDYSGLRPGFAPEEMYNVGSEYSHSLFGGEMQYAINAEYVGSHNVHESLDPNGYQDSYYMINANIIYRFEELVLRLTGNNLTNEYVKTYQSNAPLSGSQFGTNTFYTFSKMPRSVTVAVQYQF